MKKLFLVAALGFAGLMSAGESESKTTENQYTVEVSTVDQGDWGCSGQLWILDDYTDEWVLVNSFSICCYDTPEQACGVVQQHLNSIASNYP
jgi:hypothetical protein